MRPGGLRRAVAVWVARRVQAWAENVVREEPGAEARPSPAPSQEPERGALEEWVARVRAAAPELLVGLELSPVDGAGAPAAPLDGGRTGGAGRSAKARAQDRTGASAPPPTLKPEPVGLEPSPAPLDGGRRGGSGQSRNRTGASALPRATTHEPAGLERSPADGGEALTARLDGRASAPARDRFDAGAAGGAAHSGPPRVLRWTERVRGMAAPTDPTLRAPEQPRGEDEDASLESARPHGGGELGPPSGGIAAGARHTPHVSGREHAERPGLSDARLTPPPPDPASRRNRAPPGDVSPDAWAAGRARAVDATPPAPARWREANLPDPWPDLPPEPQAADLDDGLLRRLERLHRIAREQRGD